MEKTKQKKIAVILGVAGLILFSLFLFWGTSGMDVNAAWVEEELDATVEYSQYPIAHYMLDFYVDSGGSVFLPWNWGENWSASIYTMLHSVVNIVWTISLLFSYFVGWMAEQAFQMDFITDAIGLISGNIQKIAGVDAGGFKAHGLLPALAPLLIVLAGGYFAWVGLLQRKTSRAISQLAAFVLMFVLGMGVIAYSGSYLNMINDFQKGFNQEVLDIGASVTLGEEEGDMVQGIRRNLYWVMIKTPYLLFQYGTSDVEEIGEDRITNLLEKDPASEEREEIVKNEVVELENGNMGFQQVVSHIGMAFLVLIVDVVIGACVLFLSGMTIVSQVLFILYVSFFPVAFVFSMFPNSGNQLKRILGKCLETMVMRPGVSLILTVVFSISMMCYRLSESGSFFWMAFLQILIYVVAVMKTSEFLGYMRIGDTGVEKQTASLGRMVADGLLWNQLRRNGRNQRNVGAEPRKNPDRFRQRRSGETQTNGRKETFYGGAKQWWGNRKFSSGETMQTGQETISGLEHPLLTENVQHNGAGKRRMPNTPNSGDSGTAKELSKGQRVSERKLDVAEDGKDGTNLRSVVVSDSGVRRVRKIDYKNEKGSEKGNMENSEGRQEKEGLPKQTNRPPVQSKKVRYPNSQVGKTEAEDMSQRRRAEDVNRMERMRRAELEDADRMERTRRAGLEDADRMERTRRAEPKGVNHVERTRRTELEDAGRMERARRVEPEDVENMYRRRRMIQAEQEPGRETDRNVEEKQKREWTLKQTNRPSVQQRKGNNQMRIEPGDVDSMYGKRHSRKQERFENKKQ